MILAPNSIANSSNKRGAVDLGCPGCHTRRAIDQSRPIARILGTVPHNNQIGASDKPQAAAAAQPGSDWRH